MQVPIPACKNSPGAKQQPPHLVQGEALDQITTAQTSSVYAP